MVLIAFMIMKKCHSFAALEVVKMSTSSAAIDEPSTISVEYEKAHYKETLA